MKVLITGASGFLGSHLVRHFAEQGQEVIALGRQQNPPQTLLSLAQYHCADLSGKIPRLSTDVCIHVAAKADDLGSYAQFKAINVRGTQKVFAAIDCSQFIQISSASLYPLLNRPIAETDVDPKHFLSAYGKSKWEAEQFLQSQSSPHKSISVLRPRAIYGTHDRVLLPRILKLLHRKQVHLPGDFRVDISMTHVSNLIHAINLLIAQAAPGYAVYNVADQATYSLREVTEKIIFGAYEKTVPIKEIPLWLTKAYLKTCQLIGKRPALSRQALHYVSHSTILQTQKIEQALGYRARVNFQQALPEILAWIKVVGIEKVLHPPADFCWQHLDLSKKATE